MTAPPVPVPADPHPALAWHKSRHPLRDTTTLCGNTPTPVAGCLNLRTPQ